MNLIENKIIIISKISDIISDGFTLVRSESHFISSSFSVSTAEELEQMIADDDSDIDVINELVVAPDETIQEKLELFLSDACFSEEDEEEIIEAVCGMKLKSKIIFPDSGAVVVIPDEYLLERFIHKLRMTANPGTVLLDASKDLSVQLRLKALVRLRNSRMKYDAGTTQFVVEFLQLKEIDGKEFSELFDFSITLLEENSGKLDILDFFIIKKRSYEKTLGTIRQVNKQLKTSAVETMMMQGIRVPPDSEEELEAKIKMAETILAVFFGYIDIPNEKPSEINLGTVSTKEDIEKTFKLLS